jgi:membrane protease YdiL (CAAX protease family)
MLWRFGWIKFSRITAVGDLKTWGIAASICVYLVLAEVFVFSGDFSFPISNPQLGLSHLSLSMATGLVEETMYRALVLVAMITAWGGTKRGQIKAILLSSLFFGINHLINLMIRPAGVVFLQAGIVILPGIFYAALVLAKKTIWPVILIHGLTNAAVNIKVSQIDSFSETIGMWLGFALVLIPVLAYTVVLIRQLPETYQYEILEAKETSPTGQKQPAGTPAG